MIHSINESNKETKEIDSGRRDFIKVVATSCGIACACYAGCTVINYMAPSKDTLAEATAEVDISNLKEGETMTTKWRGKPIFIKYRTAKEIQDAESTPMKDLVDPAKDQDRVSKNRKNILVVTGICTHLGCIPIGLSGGNGDYGGWFCPCHGSHYDTSGRIRKGPAPKNLEVPDYRFASETLIIIGEKDSSGKSEANKTALADNQLSYLM